MDTYDIKGMLSWLPNELLADIMRELEKSLGFGPHLDADLTLYMDCINDIALQRRSATEEQAE